MLSLIAEWRVFEEYVTDAPGFYQTLTAGDGCEIRVMSGKLGFMREFKDGNDELLNRIIQFCKVHRFINISERLQDEDFFK